MSNTEIGFLGLGVALVLIALRLPIGIALGGTAIIGIGMIRGPIAAYATLRDEPFSTAAHFSLSAIPMFILMGAVANHGGLSAALFRAARLWFSFLPGSLAIASNLACAGFSAASGSSLATTAAIGRISIPQMLSAGYDKSLATGSVAAGGTLGVMIPPSLIFIIYGIFAEVPIGDLFIAGIAPGLLTLFVYCVMIVARCRLNPALAPKEEVMISWPERFRALGEIWPIVFLVLVVIGVIYAGIATPTEAGALGAFSAIVISVLNGSFNSRMFADSVLETVITTARVFFIVIGAVLFTRFMAQAGVAPFLAEVMVEQSPSVWVIVGFSAVLFLVLGMFLDTLGLLLLTLPLLVPMFEGAGLNLIWFGVLTVKFAEIGMITPPVGLNVYVLNSITGNTVPLERIFRGAAWFLACEVVVCGLLVAFPEISLFLVDYKNN